MKKIYWLRRIALLLSTFAVGVLVTGSAPVWLKFAFPLVAIWWLMLYDEATFERNVRRNASERR